MIYIWRGCECNMFEKLKATEVANDIRDNERKGRAEVITVEEGEEPEALITVSFSLILLFEQLHSGHLDSDFDAMKVVSSVLQSVSVCLFTGSWRKARCPIKMLW